MNTPEFSVIIPALGEAATINRTLGRVNALAGGRGVEAVVVDGDPDASTLDAIRPDDAPDIAVQTVTAPKGRAKQMNAGAALATGDNLMFLHADTLLPDDAFGHASRALDKFPAGAFDLGIESADPYIRLVGLMGRNRTRVTRVPYGDQAIFARREYFNTLGGFDEIPLMEDVEFMRRIGRRGDAVAILRPRVTTSARRWEQEGPFYTTLRNWALVSLYLLGADPVKLARYYKPHGKAANNPPNAA